ncbi:unnamed protein product, partial [Staurois parvus]
MYKILANHVHPMVQTLFPEDSNIYQDDNAPIYTADVVKSWFNEHAEKFSHRTQVPLSPDLNIIEPLWSIFENKFWDNFLP